MISIYNILIFTIIKIISDNIYHNILKLIMINIFIDNIYYFRIILRRIFECRNYLICALFETFQIKRKFTRQTQSQNLVML